MKVLLRLLCVVGVHWRGKKNLGMYSDAARCSICGCDAYGLFVVHEDKP